MRSILVAPDKFVPAMPGTTKVDGSRHRDENWPYWRGQATVRQMLGAVLEPPFRLTATIQSPSEVSNLV